ncbi:MAG: hypothetical protein ACLGSD_10250 [Acidobacteriota bacterium]
MLVAVALAGAAMYLRYGKGARLIGASLLGILLSASTTAILALGIGFILVLFSYPPIRFPWYLRKTRVKRVGFLAAFGVCGLSVLAIPVVLNSILAQTVDKTATSYSAAVRLVADLYALRVAYDTYGIGAGLGSTRASSLIATTLGTIGVVGLVALVVLVTRLFQNELGEYFWLKWAAAGLLLNMAFGVPDLALPLLWVPLALIARAAQSGNNSSGTNSASEAW